MTCKHCLFDSYRLPKPGATVRDNGILAAALREMVVFWGRPCQNDAVPNRAAGFSAGGVTLAEMFRVILLQAAAVALASAIGGSIAGLRGGISSALGGAACVLPNLLLALYLKFAARRPGVGFLVHFLSGEFVKLALIAGLLVVIARGYDNLHWPSLLIGLVLAVQALFFWGFWKKN